MDSVKIPSHVAIIMDGNGRWALNRGKKRSYGHRHGSANVETVAMHAFKSGVKSLTLYAFSCENWARPKEEVDELMKLLKTYFNKHVKENKDNGVRLRVIGDRHNLKQDLLEIIEKAENATKDRKDYTLNLAINYGGRQEIVRVVNNLIKENKPVTAENINQNLDTYECGEPDLIIRTGGEYRISNFLLYQGAYSELYFTDVLWPDFNEVELDKALKSFGERKRRFGKV